MFKEFFLHQLRAVHQQLQVLSQVPLRQLKRKKEKAKREKKKDKTENRDENPKKKFKQMKFKENSKCKYVSFMMHFATIALPEIHTGFPSVAQQVKDPALSLLWLGSSHRFSSYPGNFTSRRFGQKTNKHKKE